MNKRRLGKSGIVVSDICMGTMTFGSQADDKTAFAILDKAFEAGINFFDTAEIYPVPPSRRYAGVTEEIVGRWMQTKNRDSLIIASKVAGPAHSWFVPPVRGGTSALDRHHIVTAVEGSLKRLQTDYLDLYQTHWPDHDMGYEETLRALEELMLAGKVRAIGCSNETSWGLTKSLWQADINGLPRFETIQNNFSLNNRRFEDELAQACRQENVSLLPYSPLAGGVLTGKYNADDYPENGRFTKYLKMTEERQRAMGTRFVNERSLASTERFQTIAEQAGMSVTTLATAWSKQHDFVASTIVGATHPDQLDDILAAADLKLNNETLQQIDRVSADILYPMG